MIDGMTQLLGKAGCRAAVNAVEANILEQTLEWYASVFAPLSLGLQPAGRVRHRTELQLGARPKSKPPSKLSQFEEGVCQAV